MSAPMRRLRFRSVACALVMAGAVVANVGGFNLSGYKWPTADVLYYVNPSSIYVSAAAATSAVQRAADVWSSQSQAGVRFVYGGTTNGTSLTMNRKSEVFFRNDANGSYVAETYTWADPSGLIDFDIVFHEGGYRFFTNSGCIDKGVYVEEAAVHELGHALGISHSGVATATMNSVMPGWCDLSQMTLDPDDIAAVESLYPAGQQRQPAPPAAPTGLTVAVSGSNPTSSLVLSWSDNASNETGYRIERSPNGSTFSYIAQVGANVRSFTNTSLTADTTYYYRVYAYNGDGQSGYSNTASGRTQAAAAEPLPPPPPPPGGGAQLSVRAYRVRGNPTADLSWSGLTAPRVDVYRGGSRLKTTANDGGDTDAPGKKNTSNVQYKVCAEGTATCTNVVTVSF